MVEFFVGVIILLIAARILGEVFQRLKLPALIGELLAGIIIGPSLFGLVQVSEPLKVLTQLGVFFLMFLAGLELRPQEIRKAGKGAAIVSIFAYVIPFTTGAAVANMLGAPTIMSLFVGLTLAITAVPVNALVLMEFGKLKSRIGTTVLTAGVIDDTMSLIILGILIMMSENGEQGLDFNKVGISIFTIVIFLALVVLLGYIFGQTGERLREKLTPHVSRLRGKESSFAIMMIAAIGMALAAEHVGLHFVVGTFFAGLLIYREIIGKENHERISNVLSTITFGFFAPLFFAFIGLHVNASSVSGQAIPLFVILLGVAIAGKMGGGIIGARIAKFSGPEAKTIGYLMNSRGMVELVIASVGYELGILDITMFSVVVLIGFVTTIMSPVMARRSFARLKDVQNES